MPERILTDATPERLERLELSTDMARVFGVALRGSGRLIPGGTITLYLTENGIARTFVDVRVVVDRAFAPQTVRLVESPA